MQYRPSVPEPNTTLNPTCAKKPRSRVSSTLENLMQLIKSTPTRGEDGENIYTDEVVMISNDPDMLRAKAHDLCQGMRIKPEPLVQQISGYGK